MNGDVVYPLRRRLEEAGASFGLGKLIAVSRVESRSFHSVFQCKFDTGVYAVKLLVQRPDLPCWRDRFERAFAVERWLSKKNCFFPMSVANFDGRAVTILPPTAKTELPDWFTVHHWVNGRSPKPNTVSQHVFRELGIAISAIAQTPLSLIPELRGTDDKIPSIEEIIDLLECWGKTDTSAIKHCNMLNKVSPMLQSVALHFIDRGVPVVGHRDVSPANTLVTKSGKIFILDWENVGVSSLESEIGRVLVHWCLGQNSILFFGVEEVFKGIGSYVYSLSDVSESWFSSWLSGHLMFLRYLLVSCEKSIFPIRACAEIGLLVQFADRMPTMLNFMRETVHRQASEK